jgi:hypothetical protein
VRGTLLRQGIAVPTTDLMIASAALVHNLTMVTHNTADYQNIPGLRLDDWLIPWCGVTMEKLIGELIELPQRLRKGDFVLNLAKSVTEPDKTLDPFVVTPQRIACFENALSFICDIRDWQPESEPRNTRNTRKKNE